MMQTYDVIHFIILVATVAAIAYGPIKAVKVTRKLDLERAERDRKHDVFRDLMRTRQIRMDPIHVGALNLVELEFYGCGNVIQSYRNYIRHLNSPLPNPDEQERHFEEKQDLFVDLLHNMGKELGYHFDRHELNRLGYAPIGWENELNIHRKNAFLLSQVLEGERPLPIAPHVSGGSKSPYPPAPTVKEDN